MKARSVFHISARNSFAKCTARVSISQAFVKCYLATSCVKCWVFLVIMCLLGRITQALKTNSKLSVEWYVEVYLCLMLFKVQKFWFSLRVRIICLTNSCKESSEGCYAIFVMTCKVNLAPVVNFPWKTRQKAKDILAFNCLEWTPSFSVTFHWQELVRWSHPHSSRTRKHSLLQDSHF